ncbi:MAG: tRNA (adenosine(37)-N6)-dimethylallyltransferase MiaA, partial [Oxalobacteraceae bacterium]
ADSTRVARALEVVRSTGKPLSHWQQRLEGGIAGQITLHPALLLPDRDVLYRRCDARFARMLDGGAIEEVRHLLARDLDPDLPVMRAIGVSEIAALLAGHMSREEALAKGAQATRNYAKRQFTWLKHQFPPHWTRRTSHDEDLTSYFETLLLN